MWGGEEEGEEKCAGGGGGGRRLALQVHAQRPLGWEVTAFGTAFNARRGALQATQSLLRGAARLHPRSRFDASKAEPLEMRAVESRGSPHCRTRRATD